MTVGVPRSKQDWLLLVGLFCFFFSGAAGLIYQVVWTRMLSQIFGNTTYAIATVLSAFMAGLAIGSYWFGKIADRGKNDFLLYGLLEAGVGVYGFLVPWFFAGAQKVYGPIFSLNESQPFLFNLFLFFLSFVLLVFPTLLMGATLPVLSRFYVRSFAQFGRRVGDLYATNTLGAVIGCAMGGFFLIPVYGMRATVYVAAGVNMLIAIVILIVDRLRDPEPVAELRRRPKRAARTPPAPRRKARLILTGCCSALSLSPVSPRWFMKMLGRARSPWSSAARSIRLRPCWSRFSSAWRWADLFMRGCWAIAKRA